MRKSKKTLNTDMLKTEKGNRPSYRIVPTIRRIFRLKARSSAVVAGLSPPTVAICSDAADATDFVSLVADRQQTD
jgi:hypothetical protein